MNRLVERNVLQEQIEFFGVDNNFTRLNLDLGEVNPNDAFSKMPYEKGYTLLMVLHQYLGEDH